MTPLFSQRREPNPLVCGRKFCAVCGRWRHACDFRLRTNGRLESWCRTCERARNRHARRTMNEEQREHRREYERIWTEAKRRAEGVPQRNWRSRGGTPRNRRLFFEAEPIVAALRRWAAESGESWNALARRLGMNPRQLHRLRTGESKSVELETADRIALAIESSLFELYGEQEPVTLGGRRRVGYGTSQGMIKRSNSAMAG